MAAGRRGGRGEDRGGVAKRNTAGGGGGIGDVCAGGGGGGAQPLARLAPSLPPRTDMKKVSVKPEQRSGSARWNICIIRVQISQ